MILSKIFIAAHAIFHFFGAIGVLIALIHANEVHGRRWWKVGLMLIWAIVLIFASLELVIEGHH